MNILICGSIAFSKEMQEAKAVLEMAGHAAVLPRSAELGQGKDFSSTLRATDLDAFFRLKAERMREHFAKIRSADAILVLNYDKPGKPAYIGPNTFLEMGVAFDLGKRIFVLHTLPEQDNAYEELLAMDPVVLDGDLSRISE
ncbi:MAG: hypothetical protein HY369_00030 [Candidatus Aenigmarchaeota archaeon]|nr:hypothetical protein [Candidatus Aenigmarchaeota archaeon]